MYRTGYNPTSGPVAIDDQGRSIGGGEWDTYDSTDPVAQRAIARNDLIEVREPESNQGVDHHALNAFAKTKVMRERAGQARNLSVDDILPVAEERQLVAPGAEHTVGELREVLSEHPEVPMPEPEPAPKSRRSSKSQEA